MYEPYVYTPRVVERTPKVTISQGGYIFFNKACRDKYLQTYEHVVYLFDRDTNRIGIRLIEGKAPENAYPIYTGKQAKVCATAFLRSIGYSSDRSRAYPCHWDGEFLVIQLDDADLG